ncbi:hypothetical protein [Aliirhizobium smilacinae]|uniref:AbrB/MazE/SpoVT family DNA-binding domain-containing protein n=1 Tax=Aliirhizobium smilacinae TaxID=1395944 RepID=A0A5C4XQ96_9HYPH|nr:hypothetical protein [Rhizobium smilacinae]TNM65449.1 hypothetical protein FHP24_04040 [Rhizobium smilacinae]
MGETVIIQRIGERCGIMLPQEHLDRLGWKEGDHVEIHSDTGHIEFVATRSSEAEAPGNRELIASAAMRNYYAALKELARN